MQEAIIINSNSTGDTAQFRNLDELEKQLMELPEAPADRGSVIMLLRKVEGGLRETLDQVILMPDQGISGDAWGRLAKPDMEAALTVMQIDVAGLIANGQPLTLFGDNIIVDMDLSASNLPPGSQVRLGSATLEITPLAHNGCQKFRGRFGDDALQVVSMKPLRHRNLHGVYIHVIEGGEVRPGDTIEVISRAQAPTQ